MGEMLHRIFASLLLLSLASGKHPAEQYYKELNCTAIPNESSPSKYDCGFLDKLKNDQCYYDGKYYPLGSSVGRDIIKDDCIVECRCDEHLGKSYFTCVSSECPTLINPTFREGCVNVYEEGSCCPKGTHCKDKDPPVPTCKYGGKTYRQGEKFYPEEKCMSCICKEGFDGTLAEPWCKKTECHFFLHYGMMIKDGCVPTYYRENDCCPIPVWRCPSDDDKIVNHDEAVPKNEGEICKFGKTALSIGERLSPSQSDKCVVCSCTVPPHVTCVMNTTCYESQFS